MIVSQTEPVYVSSLARNQLAEALVRAEDDSDNDYLGFVHDIGTISQDAGVDIETGRLWLTELLQEGVLRKSSMHSADQFVVGEGFKAWRRRMGL